MKTQFSKALLPLCVCSLAVLFTGCGSGVEPLDVELQSVDGTVTLNGSPLANASVTFIPEGSSAVTTYFGATDEAGKFVLKNRQGMEGCEAGKYKVVISKRVLSDGSPMPSDDSPEAAALAADSKELLPEKYSNVESTELMYEVPAGGKSFDIQLSE